MNKRMDKRKNYARQFSTGQSALQPACRLSLDAVSGRVVIAALDDELLVKKLVRRRGKVLLVPANPDYPVIDITEREYVNVWGVVTWVSASFDGLPRTVWPLAANIPVC